MRDVSEAPGTKSILTTGSTASTTIGTASTSLIQPAPQALAIATATSELMDAEGLTAQDFTNQRNDAMREGVKALLLMNGGSAVALLAFLQAIWKVEPALVKYILWGIGFLVVGVILAGLVHLFRVRTSNATQQFLRISAPTADRQNQHKLAKDSQLLYFAFAYFSLFFFAAGVITILLGAGCVRIVSP